ncbi:MAG: Na/Pi cotransporter family protein, partial [Holdemanella sp.]|nr:Na/Pi cotransporter family protein [Holdemanella sp.]
MDFFSILTMVGGLALFLYGMKIMGDALSKMAGGKLEQILEKATNNPIKAVLLGAGVTAIIQSSSATTVMVVGFVNSGIMKLSQAIGVIMGANIGTTITSWILSLSGIESSNFFIKLLKPSSFSPVLALIGIVFIMFLKSEKKKDIGTILIGFAILMFGMETMSGAVKPLANVPEFTSLFTAFQNPILGMLVGAILTAIIQSSSASVGILQAMCVTGSVTIGAALPVIMGQNIGTCVTALISSIGASKNARRASLIHLYFNLIGTVLFMSVFYGINVFVHFTFLQDTASAATIAIIHSIFNIVATIVLLPMGKLLEKLAFITIPYTEDEDKDTEVNILDERFLERPGFALVQCKNAICDIANIINEMMAITNHNIDKFSKELNNKVIELEDVVDLKEDELSSYMTKLASKSLSEEDSHKLNLYSKCITDFERISDYLKGIAYGLKKIDKRDEPFSDECIKELKTILSASDEIIECTVSSFKHDDLQTAVPVSY